MAKLTKGMKWSDFTGKPHWTQTPAGKRKMAAAQRKIWRQKRSPLQQVRMKEIAKDIVHKAKRSSPHKQVSKQTSLVVNGWRITLGASEIRIDHE